MFKQNNHEALPPGSNFHYLSFYVQIEAWDLCYLHPTSNGSMIATAIECYGIRKNSNIATYWARSDGGFVSSQPDPMLHNSGIGHVPVLDTGLCEDMNYDTDFNVYGYIHAFAPPKN